MLEILNRDKIKLIRCKNELIDCQSVWLKDLCDYIDYINKEIVRIHKMIINYCKTL